MKEFSLKEIESKVEGKIIQGCPSSKSCGIAIDTRVVKPDNVFVAILGKNNDAHDYISQALEKGCKSFIISDEKKAPKDDDVNVILVEDTTEALKNFTKNFLAEIPAKKIAVTGSVGKTTTRDMIYYICKEKYKTGANKENSNTKYGIPMALAEFDGDEEVVVLEIGMDRKGEIDELVQMIKPDVGVITNVGISHIENFNNKQIGILNAKLEIKNYFDKDNLLIINGNSGILNKDTAKGDYRLQTVAAEAGDGTATVTNVVDFGEKGIEYDLTVEGQNYHVKLYIPGRHNAVNSALAILVGLELGIDVETAISGLQKMQLAGKRLSIKETKTIKVIDDTYNACPDSMKSALLTLMSSQGNRKIAILGDMYELGATSLAQHRLVGEFADRLGINTLVGIGELGAHIADRMVNEVTEVYTFPSKEDFYNEMTEIIQDGDTVLVKASRGMKMEKIVEKIMETYK